MAEVSHLVEIHATIVETACASETKRQSVSVTSAGLLSAGVALAAANQHFAFEYMILPAMIISAIWFVTVRFYQKLAKAKWEVVKEIETRLPFQPFTREWEIYQKANHKFTFGPSTLEQVIPALIFIGTVAYAVTLICQTLF
jgi:hypothetical protein